MPLLLVGVWEGVVEEGVVEEGEVVVPPLLEAGAVCSFVPPLGVAVMIGVFGATGMIDEPAVTVEVAVAAAPPASLLHAKSTAGTPLGPSK